MRLADRLGPAGHAGARGTRRRNDAKAALSEQDQSLFEALRATRTALARELAVPPYVIFPDTTLIALASHRPGSAEAMLEIQGVGKTKLQRYGAEFLDTIRAHG